MIARIRQSDFSNGAPREILVTPSRAFGGHRMRTISVASLLSLAVLSAAPIAAHHSFAAQFDGSKPITLEGAVTKVEWRNPHIWVYLDVKNPDGSVTAWECEGGAPNALTRQGWSRKDLEGGEPLTIVGYLAKDGSKTCNARTWKVGDRTVLAGSNDGGPPAAR